MKPLKRRSDLESSEKLSKKYDEFDSLMNELNDHQLPNDVILQINTQVDELNNFIGDEKGVLKKLRKSTTSILNVVRKELNLVTKRYYQNLWMVLGMSMFGIPFGMVLGFSVDNFGLFGAGLPMGMGIGIIIGNRMDTKAQNEGRQLSHVQTY